MNDKQLKECMFRMSKMHRYNFHISMTEGLYRGQKSNIKIQIYKNDKKIIFRKSFIPHECKLEQEFQKPWPIQNLPI